ncbi:MAG TPA: rhodanese-like domain-containing protein [Fimbriimonas sp.]
MAKSLRDMVNEALQTVREVDPEEAQRLIGEGWKVLDVREPHEYAKGHLEGATNVPRGFLEVRADLEHPSRYKKFEDRSQRFMVYSGNGGFRSVLACKVLKEMGFGDAVSLKGGWNRWKEMDLPYVTPYDPVS